uniref:S8 family serine peptidase n=1 Tax=Flavobacterium sp. TaxID=239 RepID=UPI0037BE3420
MKVKILICSIFLFCFSMFSNAQTREQQNRIIKSYNIFKLDSLKNVFESRFYSRKTEAIQFSKINNIPERFVDEKGSYHELMYIENDRPIYYKTHNSGSANTIKVNRINSGGSAGLNLNGQNMILGIWDGGPVRSSHQDLVGRVTIMDLENFVISNEGTSHATHVAGTMLGSGFGNNSARGMAYQANLWANTFANDEAEVISQISQGLLVSNHSYGIPAENVQPRVKGAYISESREWDLIMNNAPYYQPVISAGNDRGTAEDTKGGRDLLIGNKTSKNSIVVAAVSNVSNYTSPASVIMSSFSSWGPTDDYRIKPDISAKGVNVNSLTSVSDTSYGSNQGTSMAAPAVSGALILLQQHYNELYSNFMRAATLKAVMINGAEETGDHDGPDYSFGWGLLNAQKSALLISNKGTSSIIDELTLTQGSTYSRNVISNGSPMRITVVWNDPAGPLSNGVEDDPTSV